MVIDIDTVMSIEEKAKAYDEAIRKIREIIIMDNAPVTPKEIGEYLFPNLKESEDENIRKALISYFKSHLTSSTEIDKEHWQGIVIKDILAWLEKQDEQKSTLRIDNSKAKVVFPFKAKVKSTGIVVTIHDGQLSIDGKEWTKYQSDNEDGYKVYEPEDLEYVCNVEPNPAWLEKQGESNFEQCIQEGDKIVSNEDGTRFNVSQLERTANKVTESKETAKKFLKTAGIMDKNGELAEEYRLEKQDEQKPTDKVEPKFKVGDTVTVKPMSCHGKAFKGEPFKIVDIIEDNYVSDDGKTYSISLQDGWELVEQKPTDKVEPKFKVGDWIAESNNKITEEDWRIGKINEIKDGKFKFESVYGYTTDFPIGTLNQYHLWTIDDARDCDVLKEDSCIFMIEKMKKTGVAMVHCCLFDDGELSPGTTLYFDVESTVPATMEECKHLFTKMKEMGYECNITDLMARKTGKEPINKELIKSVKTEPKFKVGDWITDGNITIQIEAIKNDCYLYCGDCALYSIKTADKVYHLWTLKDAKDGDVLAFDNDNIVIFKDLYNYTSFHSYCHIEDGIFDFSTDELPDWWEDEGFKPATKEQCDLLFQKIKEAGYEWDSDKKELKITDWSKHIKYESNSPSIFTKESTWSEEDTFKVQRICKYLDEAKKYYADITEVRECIDWLKSLKQRLKGE